MSQMMKTSLAGSALALLCLLSVAGCGDQNSGNNFDSSTGKHPAGWVSAGHQTAAQADLAGCSECHGADFQGGVSGVACTSCHLGDQTSVHPVSWGAFTYAEHGAYVQQNGYGSCANASCHGSELTGVAGSGPSCTSCHMGGALSAHPTSWTQAGDHGAYVQTFGAAACVNAVCHGTTGQGVPQSGPACITCHR